MSLKAALVLVLISVSLSSAYTPCRQRSAQDFRADDNDCGVFHMCSMGQLVTFSCSTGSVYDERSHSCVPAYSFYDRCSSRLASKQRCPPGTRGAVPHPTHCAQYYECGATHAQNRLGWEGQLRECPYPYVFSSSDKKCVQPAPGVCGIRQEPLDQCDYKVNQCEGHAGCVPCHVRFPSCRGLQDGLNAWSGRQGSPYYVTCHQQRVVASAMCKQEGAVAIFDAELRECVKKEEVVEEPEVPQLPRPIQQTRPQTAEHQGYIPQHQSSYQQTSYLGNQNQQQQGGYQQGYRPQYPARNQNQYQPNQNQYQPNQNQYQPGRNQNQYEPSQYQQSNNLYQQNHNQHQQHVPYVWV